MRVSRITFSKLKKLNKYGETYKSYPLKNLTTFKVGGDAKYFLKICTLESFIKVILHIDNYPYFIIGNGSNILASDKGYEGIVIKLAGDFDRIMSREEHLECGAGVTLSQAYRYAKERSLSGFEKLATIPATIGGAISMNAGAFGCDISMIVDYVVAYHDGKIRYYRNSDCKFAYRKSIFQKNFIILRAGFLLTKSDEKTIEDNFRECLSKRQKSQSVGFPNAGCVFKNQEGIIVSKMLDEMGAKELSCGGAKVSDIHANFIVNYSQASSQDIWNLINIIKEKFYDKYKIKIETELKFLGEFNETIR